MIKQARFNKKQQVVNELVRQIESGLMEDGYVLPGEEQLAEELGVSRSTLHKALMELERRKYIARRTAGGSVVTFDGIPLDQKRVGRKPWPVLARASIPNSSDWRP